MAVAFICFVFPLLWVLSTSLKTVSELFVTPPLLFPPDPQWGNFVHVLNAMPMLRYIGNSVAIVFLTVLLVAAVGIPAAYGLSRFAFRRRRVFMRTILAAQLISPIVIVVPLYRMLVQLGLLNSFLPLVIVYAAVQLPFTVWFLKGFFDTIPIELDEAALTDGASRLRSLWSVVLPVARPGIASALIIVAVSSWSQFVIPYILLNDQKSYPVSVGVVNLKSTIGGVTTQYLAAGALLSIIPVIIVFVFLQRFIIGALMQGAIKG